MQETECKCPPAGAPLWMITFADLMSLLMSFFVLILSFSNMDTIKYKNAVGSIDAAFGIHRLNTEHGAIPQSPALMTDYLQPGKPELADDARQIVKTHQAPALQIKNNAYKIAELMVDEIKAGKVEVAYNPHTIVLRLNNQASFPQGSDKLRHDIISLLEKMRMRLVKMPGSISVAGHTDDLPTAGSRFPSNWELSSARAIAVAKVLMDEGKINKNRFSVDGFADTKPLVPNSNSLNRQRNRRVEIIVEAPKEKQKMTVIDKSGKKNINIDSNLNNAFQGGKNV